MSRVPAGRAWLALSLVMISLAGANEDRKDAYINEQLIKAVRNRESYEAQRLLDIRADPNFKTASGDCALYWAARHGDTVMVRMLLENGAAPNTKSDGGVTPLWFATARGNIETVRYLLTHGAEISNEGPSLVCKALREGYHEILSMLLEAGADPDHRDVSGYSAPLLAAKTDDSTALRILLEHGADPGVLAPEGQCIWDFAGQKTRKLLIGCPAEGNPLFLQKALLTHCRRDDPQTVKMLLDKGVSPEYRVDRISSAEYGYTALRYAVERNDTALARLLLDNGAKLSPGVLEGRICRESVFARAITNSGPEMLELLLQSRAIPDDSVFLCGNGGQVLMFPSYLALAASFGKVHAIETLVSVGADIDKASPAGQTALMYALCNPADAEKTRRTVELLIEAGADVNAACKTYVRPYAEKETALFQAVRRNDLELVNMLINAGARVDVENGDGYTPLASTRVYRKQGWDISKDIAWALEKAGGKRRGDRHKANPQTKEVSQGKDDSLGTKLAECIHDPAAVTKLLQRGANPNVLLAHTRPDEETPFCRALFADEPEVAALMVSAGADVNYRLKTGAYQGITLLSYALVESKNRAAQFLLDKGASPKNEVCPAGSMVGANTVSIAAMSGMIDFLARFKQDGMDVCQRFEVTVDEEVSSKMSPLMFAVFGGNSDAVKWLIDQSCNADDSLIVSMGGQEGVTSPLVTAVTQVDIEMVRLLLDAGADPEFRCVGGDIDGQTALDLARDAGSEEIVALLESARAKRQ